MQLKYGSATLGLVHPVVMGILNVTPDSFSDGGKYISVNAATEQALNMLSDGAQIIDVGGESTRPGACAVSTEEECERVIPVITSIREKSDCIISIDTSKAEVMHAAINAGANMINDVRALQEPNAIEMAVKLNVPVCLMHMKGEPRTMQSSPVYSDVVEEVKAFLLNRAEMAIKAGISANNIILDPGFGFGKTIAHNLALFKGLNRFADTGYPLMVGVSRKSMVGTILNGAPVEDRLYGSVALAALASFAGAMILRVHDVKPTIDAIQVAISVKTGVEQKEVN